MFLSTCKSSGSWTQRFLPVFWQKRSARSRRDILNCEQNSSLHMFNLKVEIRFKKVKRAIVFLRFGLQLPLKLLKVRNAEICASLCCAVELFDSKWNKKTLKNWTEMKPNWLKCQHLIICQRKCSLIYTCHSHNLDLSMLVPCYFMTIWANWRGLRKCMVQNLMPWRNGEFQFEVAHPSPFGECGLKFIPHKTAQALASWLQLLTITVFNYWEDLQ